MLYNFQRKKLCRHLLFRGALCVAGLAAFSCSDKYDLDSEQPSGLNSIYGYIQQQENYTKCLRLIDDLGQTDIFSKTGSKTLFIADDDAFDRFFKSNDWGVSSYEELSLAQKKLLLNTAMVDNPLTTSMISTAGGSDNPVRGEVFRRATSTSLFDSVLVVPSSDPNGILPDNDRFRNLRANHENIVLFTDASTSAPMLHFNSKFLSTNKLLSSDIDFLYNQPAGTREQDDVYVNNAKVTEANVFCKNGFVHKVDQVILPLDNMAEVIRKNPDMSIYSSILERFAAVSDSTVLTNAYNRNKGTEVDSVFIKRYYSERSAGGAAFTLDKDKLQLDGQLVFDPGWNGYTSGAGSKGSDPMMEDMAVMFVPTNEAITEWWNNGSGKVIKEFYETLEKTPNSTLDDLIRANQQPSFITTVPSTFDQVKEVDSKELMGITVDDVDEVFLACNGAVYLTNKVFTPKTYSSVLFPTVIDTLHFSLMDNAIKKLAYGSYLNSMVAEYIFLLPTNNGMLTYIDPVSYGQDVCYLWEFSPRAGQKNTSSTYIQANVYKCVKDEYGKWQKGEKALANALYPDVTSSSGVFKDRFEDMLDNIIAVEPYQPGKKFYRTKGNSFIRVDGITEGSHVYGSWQLEQDEPLEVSRQYHMENGDALVVDGVAMGASKSVAKVLSEHDEFSVFKEMLAQCGALNTQNSKDKWSAGDQVFGNLFNIKTKGAVGAEDASSDKATYLLNNYHYTLYAPTNDAIQAAINKYPDFPSLEKLQNAEQWDNDFADATQDMSDAEKKEYAASQGGVCLGDSADRVAEAMLDFVKYHIQDNALFIDEGFESGSYLSGKTELIASTDEKDNVEEADLSKYNIVKDGSGKEVKTYDASTNTYTIQYYTGLYSPGRPYRLNVNVSSTDLSVNGIHVDTASDLYNLMAREYWYDGTKVEKPWTSQINNSSTVVIHAINEVLLYDAPAQFTYTYKPLTKVKD